MFNKKCIVCNKDFVAKKKDGKVCSKECLSERLAHGQRKEFGLTVEKIQNFREAEISLEKMSVFFGCTKTTLCKFIKDNGLTMSKEEIKEANANKIKRMNLKKYDEKGRLCCNRCFEWKNKEDFYKMNTSATGRRHTCRTCSEKEYCEKTGRKERELGEAFDIFVDGFLSDLKIKSPSEEGPNS